MSAYYKESQKFTQIWIWILLAVTIVPAAGFMTYGLLSQLLTGVPWGDEPISDVGLTIMTVLIWVILGGIFVILLSAELKFEIRDKAIYYRFTILSPKLKKVKLEDLENWQVRKFGFFEYGGYGVRHKIRKTTAFIVSGRMGLELNLKSGKTIMIGTQKPEEVKKAMQNEWDRFAERRIDG